MGIIFPLRRCDDTAALLFSIHSLSKLCEYRSPSTVDLLICIRCVFVRKESIYIGKLEIVMGVGFIFYLSKHKGTKKDMACISQSFGLVKEKDVA